MAKGKGKRNKKEEEVLVDLIEAKEQARNVFEKFQIPILGGLLLIVVGFGGYFGYNQLVKLPKEKEAVEQLFKAEQQFQRDSFALAMTNPGSQYPGFLDFIDEYGSTKAGNLAKYYAGISYLHLDEFDAAIDFLKEVKPGGKVIPATRNGAIGDAYAEKGDFDSALDYYKKAASAAKDDYLAPYYLMKTGMLCERLSKNEDALKYYQEIKDNYPNSIQGASIDKFIGRLNKG